MAQQSYNYREWAIGITGGMTKPFCDLQKTDFGYSGGATITYNYNPYIPLTAEFQFGRLSGGDIFSDKDTRQFTNNYKAALIYGDVQLGSFIEYSYSGFLDAIKGFYGGTGVGFIMNNNKTNRYSRTNVGYRFPGVDKSSNFMVPVRFGYEFKIFDAYDDPYLRITIGYVHNFTFGEGLDGYNDPPEIFKNDQPDQYNQITIGIRYDFGREVSYNKFIRRIR
ncbi:hypothetical protein GCM10023149_38690 [Mucilaginibacter gynuensis]|uniref:Outer membrane protein beta-barrel domain-containing protein n=1 Tax=Mucilaginibacter gynuensis TaxID=1302236 RepID=A0ABP8H0U0_9SPHI